MNEDLRTLNLPWVKEHTTIHPQIEEQLLDTQAFATEALLQKEHEDKYAHENVGEKISYNLLRALSYHEDEETKN